MSELRIQKGTAFWIGPWLGEGFADEPGFPLLQKLEAVLDISGDKGSWWVAGQMNSQPVVSQDNEKIRGGRMSYLWGRSGKS